MDTLQPGQMLGSYRIISQIGQGGMATIYKAYQASMDRNVAIKVLPNRLAESSEFTKRFQQEARIIARLEHPHILPVFDYGESDGIPYFVMRYFEDGSLQNRMEAGPLSLTEIDRIFTQLADALGYAHSHGVIHRDLKPSNALLDSQGNLFLTDFGIAKILESTSTQLTQADVIMGTPAYISPEQAQSRTVDQRTDIYSLGIILYEMVTGRVPFVAETPLAVVLMHVSDRLPLPTSIKADTPESIERVILKALAKEPDDRFSTAGEFLAAWHSALEDTGSKSERQAATIIAPQTVLQTEIAKPAITPNASGVRTQAKPALATKTPSNSGGSSSIGWIIGCLIVACLFFTIAGAGVYVFNAQGFFSQGQEPVITDVPASATVTNILPPENTPTPAAVNEPILEDDFSSQDWGTGTDSDSSVEYDGETLRMIIYTTNYYVWSTPDDVNYDNVHMEVTVLNNSTDSATAFGFICDKQEATASHYFLGITPGGEYVIGLAADGQEDVFLTNDNAWGDSSLIANNADSYRVSVECENGRLALYVDGQLVDEVFNSTYTSGGVALFTWSGDEVTNVDVSFDDFQMTQIK